MAREVWCNETAAFDEGGALSVISVMSIVQSNLQRSVASKRDSVGSDELRTLMILQFLATIVQSDTKQKPR